MREKKKLAIIIISISAFIAISLTLFLVELFTTPKGIFEYELDGYNYQIEVNNGSISGGDACFYIPSNGKEINIPEEITVKHGMFSEKYTINEIHFDYDFHKYSFDPLYIAKYDWNLSLLETKIIVPKTVSSIRKKGFGMYTYALFGRVDKKEDFFVCNVGEIKVASDNPYFDSREDSNCIIDSKTDKIIVAGLKNPKIPSTVTGIGSFAFWLIDTKELTIPGNVKKIDSCAFMECNYLNKLAIEEGVEVVSSFAFVGNEVFYGGFHDHDFLKEIEELYVPSTIKEISTNAFALFSIKDSNVYYNGSDLIPLIKGPEARYSSGDLTALVDYFDYGYFYVDGTRNLEYANIYLYSENAPETDGLYWHYVDGKITVWE